MKILHILPYSDMPTSMIFAKRQIASLEALKIENEIYFVKSRFNILSVLKSCLEIKRKVKTLKPDVIHCHYGTITAFITSFGKAGKPLVVSFHGSDLNGANDISALRSFFGKLLSAIAANKSARIVLSNDKLMKRLSVKNQKKATVIPVGINTNQFIPMDLIKAREELKWDLDEFVVLFNANNPKVKRLDIAEKILEKLKALKSDIRFEFLSGNIDANKIPLLINAANCVLVCSDSEGSPTIVKEALACNVPVVSNDVGDVKARLNGVIPGGICEQSVDAYVDAIKNLKENYQRSNGREKLIKDRLTENLIALEIIDIYKSCI